jgi:hypothetical protein
MTELSADMRNNGWSDRESYSMNGIKGEYPNNLPNIQEFL